MDQPPLPLAPMVIPVRRGRPRGAKNKRSVDLARYVEATFGGLTPGQQSAQIALVTPREVRDARAELKAQGLRMDPVLFAQARKAAALAALLGCHKDQAWVLLAKERFELLAYVHQKRPQAADEPTTAKLPTAFILREGEAMPQIELDELDEAETLTLQGIAPDAA